MLAIRMQRTGRKGHAMFRVVVQDARRTPTSGKIVARLGSYDPHAKNITLDKEKASFYLEHGAQPSGRVAHLLKQEGIKLPSWVKQSPTKERAVRNADKRRSTRPDEPAKETAADEAPATAEAAEATTKESAETEQPAAKVTEIPAEEPVKAEESETPEAPAAGPAASEEEKTPEAAKESTEVADETDKPEAKDAPAKK
jgi:small subunit ribosomal protein S16